MGSQADHKSDTAAKVPTMDTYLANIQALNKAGASPPVMGAFVVYDLPDRDCAALASNGEYSIANGGKSSQERSFITDFDTAEHPVVVSAEFPSKC